jgi:hypothetical protein
MLGMSDLQIDEFGEYLVTRSLCDEQHQRFYLYWVKRFFRDSEAWQADTWDVLLQQFVNALRDDPSVQDWQVAQAEKAVRLYFHNFRSSDSIPSTATRSLALDADGSICCVELLSAVRQSLPVVGHDGMSQHPAPTETRHGPHQA